MTRRLIKLLLIAMLFGILLFSLLALWGLRSDGGRDFLMARIAARLPEGSSLTWTRLEGTMWDGMAIHGLRYADGKYIFTARRIDLKNALWPLLSQRLDIETLKVDTAALTLPVDDEPFELPRWPEFLPAIEMPMTVAVDDLHIGKFLIQDIEEKLVLIHTVDGKVTLAKGLIDIPKLEVASNRGNLSLKGEYVPSEKYRTQLTGHYVAVTKKGVEPARLSLNAKGDIDQFKLAFRGNAPAPLILDLYLQDGSSKPRWSFNAGSERLLPEQFGMAPDQAWAFSLHGVGVDGDVNFSGNMKRGEQALQIEPSLISINAGVLQLNPLQLRVEAGLVSVEGKAEFIEQDPVFDLLLSSKQLLLVPENAAEKNIAVNGSAAIKLAGKFSAWNVDGDAILLRGKDKAVVKISGRGDEKKLLLDKLDAVTPTGKLQGKGKLFWEPGLGGELQASLNQFNPAYFFPDFPGAVNGIVDIKVRQNIDELWTGEARIQNISGRLRDRALAGEAETRWDGKNGNGKLALNIGASRIKAGGRFGERYDIAAEFSPLNLNDISPDGGGQLQGSLNITGPSAAPNYKTNLTGNAMRWGKDSIGQLTAQGELPGSGKNGQLYIRANAINIRGQALQDIDAQLSGNTRDLRVQANAAFDYGKIKFDISAAGANQNWKGALHSLQFAPRLGEAWGLQAPAKYRFADGSIRLDNTCLRTGSSARVCAIANGNTGHIEGRDLPLSLLDPWISESMPDQNYRPYGVVNLEGNFARTKANAWNGDVAMRSAAGGLRLNTNTTRDVVSYSNLKFDLKLLGERVDMRLNALLPEQGSINGELQTGFNQSAALKGKLTLNVNELTWLELMSPDLAGPKGRLAGQLLFSGNREVPNISGSAHLDQFLAELPGLGIRITEGDITLRGEPSGQARLNGVLSSGKGKLQLNGSLDLADKNSPLQLILKGENITVANTPDLRADMSPDLNLVYQDGLLKMTGTVVVPSARIDLERLDQSVPVSSDIVVLDPREAPETGGFLVESNITLQLGNDVQLKGFGLDGRLVGSLHINDQPGRPALATGTIEARGRYTAYGQALRIQRSRLTYANTAINNPYLDIVAERNFEDVTVGLRVRGSAQAPETTITSSPAMQASEALSWLILGRPLITASSADSKRLDAAALALSAGGNMLAQQLGTKIGLDEAGIVESRALGGAVFTVGKKISPRLFVSYGVSLLGTGQVMTLKYMIRRGFDVSIESGKETAASLNWRKEK
ncbi:MAG: translocation/assembly module TamB domain-containing protein [Arenimonas sp.]